MKRKKKGREEKKAMVELLAFILATLEHLAHKIC